METSIFIAKILGPYFVVVTTGVFLNIKTYQQLTEDFFKNTAILYFGGLLALIFGLVMVNVHNVWILDWPVIMTIIGWMGLTKGICLIVIPKKVENFSKIYRKKPEILKVNLGIFFVIGLLLILKGYGLE